MKATRGPMNDDLHRTHANLSTLSPMGYQILWLLLGASKPPPPEYQRKSYFRPHFAIEHLLLGIFRNYIKKITRLTTGARGNNLFANKKS